jgi:hypothetical protein
MDRQQTALDNMNEADRKKIEDAMELYGVNDLAAAQQAMANEAQITSAKQLSNLVENITNFINGPGGMIFGAVQFLGALGQITMALQAIKAIEITTALARIAGMSAITFGAASIAALGAAAAAGAYFASDIVMPSGGETATGAFGSMTSQRGANRKAILDGDQIIHVDPRDDVAAMPGLADMINAETPINGIMTAAPEAIANGNRSATANAPVNDSGLMQQMVKLLTELVANSRNPQPAIITEKGIGELNRSMIAMNQRRTQYDNTYGRTV